MPKDDSLCNSSLSSFPFLTSQLLLTLPKMLKGYGSGLNRIHSLFDFSRRDLG